MVRWQEANENDCDAQCDGGNDNDHEQDLCRLRMSTLLHAFSELTFPTKPLPCTVTLLSLYAVFRKRDSKIGCER